MDTEQNINTTGYTLIELVITITLTAIIFSIVSVFIASPIKAYSDIAKRADLVNSAEVALKRIERDIHRSLPNSIRVKSIGNKWAIEMINIVEGVRYREKSLGSDPEYLTFNSVDTEFSVWGIFRSAQLGNNNYRLVIYNIGTEGVSSDDPVPGTNVYAFANAVGPNPPAGTHVITPSTTTVTLSNPSTDGHVVLNPGFQFAFTSPYKRLYVVDTPISYICDPNEGTITRFINYPITNIQPIDPLTTPLNTAQGDLLANHTTACSFQYQPGTSRRGGITTIAITIAKGSEQIRLLQQVSVSNAP